MTKLLALSLLVGCAPQPSAVKLDGPASVVVHNTNAVNLPNAQVLAADGATLEGACTPVWYVSPAEVASLDAAARTVVPVADGDATVTLTCGPVSQSFALVVALPDEVAIAGLPADGLVNVGSQVHLTGAVYDAGAPLTDVKVSFAVDNAEVATIGDDGMLTGVAPGTAKVTATFEGVSTSADITVAAPAAVADAGDMVEPI